MAIKTYSIGFTQSIDLETGRWQSGKEVGINANAYGYYAFMSLFSLGMIMNIFKRNILTLFMLLVFAASIHINIVTASRAGLSMTVLSGVFIYMSLTFRDWANYFLKLFVCFLVLIFIVVNVENLFGDFFIVKRFIAFTESGEDSRLTILKEGVSLFLAHPLGVGAGHFHHYMDISKSVGKYATAHNGFLLVAVNYGILALIVYVSLFIHFIKNSIELVRSQNITLKKHGLISLSYGLLFFVYNFFYDMILNMFIMFLFFIMNYHLHAIKNGKIPILSRSVKNEFALY